MVGLPFYLAIGENGLKANLANLDKQSSEITNSLILFKLWRTKYLP